MAPLSITKTHQRVYVRKHDLERAAQTALEALKALGYQGMSMDFAVRGVCADCATGAAA